MMHLFFSIMEKPPSDTNTRAELQGTFRMTAFMEQILFEIFSLPAPTKVQYIYLLINCTYAGTVSTNRLYVQKSSQTVSGSQGKNRELTGSNSLPLQLDALCDPSPSS